jgi:hypothetical protein
MIFKWFQQYQQKHYNLVGVVDIMRPDGTDYRWGKEALGYVPQSNSWITIFQRKN